MVGHDAFEAAALACDEVLAALEGGEVIVDNLVSELDRALHMLASIALAEVNQSWHMVADGLIDRRRALKQVT